MRGLGYATRTFPRTARAEALGSESLQGRHSPSVARATAFPLDLYFARMTRVAVVLGVCAFLATSGVSAQDPPAPSMRGETLHRMTLLRAAPGRLLELVAAVKG